MALTIEDAVTLAEGNPLKSVMLYAESNYSKGWDCVVEACEPADIIAVIGSTKSGASAINKVYAAFVKPYKIQIENHPEF